MTKRPATAKLQINECRSCNQVWQDLPGAWAVYEGCPGCGHLYWTVRAIALK